MRELPRDHPRLESPGWPVLRAMSGAVSAGLSVVTALAVLLRVVPASAQVPLGPFNLEGEIEAGVRLLPDRPAGANRQKFEEYRDIPEGAFLGGLRLRVFTPDEQYSVQATGSKWGQADQEFGLGGGRLGLWNLDFTWDQTPHVLSTTARLLESEAARGIFTLPTPRPPLTDYNFGRRVDAVSLRWDTGKFSFSVTPTPDVELRADYTRIHKSGDRPLGIPFGGPGSNVLEILEPVDQTIHDLRLKASVAREAWQLQLGYAFSLFDNGHRAVTADNPCFGLSNVVTAARPGCGADGVGAPATGGVSLPPSNQAHTWNVAGGVNLPMNTRLSASVAYGLRLQNAGFLPQTVNSALASPLLGLPAGSLDGMVATTLVSLQAVTRPWSPLTLTARYRYYDYNDVTRELQFSARALDDRVVVPENVKALRPDYTKQNADLDTRWRLGGPLALTVGAGWERWSRNDKVREVPTSDEYFGKVAIDATAGEWLTARLTYRPSARRLDEYHTWAHYTALHVDPVTSAALAGNQSPLLRKYDEGERDRQRVDLLVQIAPGERLGGTVSAGYRGDDYLRSPLGLERATSWSAGADVTLVPCDGLTVVAGYVREWIFEKQRSRSAPDLADSEWISDNADTVDTAHVGLQAKLSAALDWTLGASYSTATGTVKTRNGGPLGGARRFPAFVDSLLRFDTALRYRLGDHWTASLGYVYERFGQHDWRSDTVNPFVPAVGSSIFLGHQVSGYDAHILAMTLGYRFR
jgi:MtrB/PioB family decaheme-associated outer membrane protein